mmetsp:Transcript_17814/g.25174  ORF Transcript_17814/g.25174 Transcript_17814/m.25174 type:complete len:544 (-) Transcript_17814:203-1834(-)
MNFASIVKTRSLFMFVAWTLIVCQIVNLDAWSQVYGLTTNHGKTNNDSNDNVLSSSSSSSSSLDENEQEESELKEMIFDLGYGTEYFMAYVQPSIESFSKGNHTRARRPKYRGHAVKFWNISPYPLDLYWDPKNGNTPNLMFHVDPFGTAGTASHEGHSFFLAHKNYAKTKRKLISFQIKEQINNYYFDPINEPILRLSLSQRNRLASSFTLQDQSNYDIMIRSKLFSQTYKQFTNRDYLPTYPRPQPIHHMWKADFFHQIHWITTKHTHFLQIPTKFSTQYDTESDTDSDTDTESKSESESAAESESNDLSNFQDTQPFLNMTLKVLSCAPRVFEIKDFLSTAEVTHILNLANETELHRSLTGQQNTPAKQSTTRTSSNTWLDRDTDPVIDVIYRRSADLLQIDESLLRARDPSEHNVDIHGNLNSIAESLQLVHYKDGQEYTSHHDFGTSDTNNKYQPTRFATLLLYLNEGMEGGETEFPRWVNGQTTRGLQVTPEVGKAVLFYSFLPDGNMDDLSHHAAKPVTDGEKYLMNLWIWDPYRN